MFLTELIIIRFTETIYYPILCYLGSENQKVVGWVHLDLNISISIFSMRLEMDQDLELDNLPKKCEKYTLIETLQLISRGPD